METIKLQNGDEVSTIVFDAVAFNISVFLNEGFQNNIALYELVEKCRNSNHKIWNDRYEELLIEGGLMQENSQIENTIRDIVQSEIEIKNSQIFLSERMEQYLSSIRKTFPQNQSRNTL